jgi:small subunit ribosomal protein S24e
VLLSDGSSLDFEKARAFMDYYCRKYRFGKPDIEISLNGGNWETVMIVGGRRIGLGTAQSKNASQKACFLDVTKYLESRDPMLWKEFVEAAKTGADLGLAPKVTLSITSVVEDAIADLCLDIRKSLLYRNRPSQLVIRRARSRDHFSNGIYSQSRKGCLKGGRHTWLIQS